MERQIRYCTTEDGVRIAYTVAGQGPPLVMTPFFTESFSLHQLVPEIDVFLDKLRPVRSVVLYDARGTGLSERNAKIDFDSALKDLGAVVDAAGVEQVAIWANFIYTPPAVQYAVQHPERLERLVFFGSMARPSVSDEMLRSFMDLSRNNWPLMAQTFGDMSTRQTDPEAGLRWGELYRESARGDTVARLFESALEHPIEVRAELAKVSIPTLVMHRKGDLNVALEMGQEVAARIPNAVFIPVPGVITHYAMGHQETVLRAALPFLGADEEAMRPLTEGAAPKLPTGTAVILFADIADSTAITERLGDAAFRAKARDLDASLRSVIREHVGTAIEGKLLGDGVLAVFTSARQAIEAAIACGRASEGAGLPLHLGLHAGDVIREDNNVYGGAVNIASRISGLSAPGEVLVSDTVRSLARTSAGVRFEDRGEQALKGVGEPVRVWAVREGE